jgi:hypothetical protein
MVKENVNKSSIGFLINNSKTNVIKKKRSITNIKMLLFFKRL